MTQKRKFHTVRLEKLAKKANAGKFSSLFLCRKFHVPVKHFKTKANARKFSLENFVDVIFLERTDYPGEKFFSLFCFVRNFIP
jgi:hypothetical protein